MHVLPLSEVATCHLNRSTHAWIFRSSRKKKARDNYRRKAWNRLSALWFDLIIVYSSPQVFLGGGQKLRPRLNGMIMTLDGKFKYVDRKLVTFANDTCLLARRRNLCIILNEITRVQDFDR